MRYGQISPVLDIEHCLELADELDPIAIDRASWAMSAQEFQSWLEVKSSRVILINGNSDPMEDTSPLSLFCAHMTHLFVAAKYFDLSFLVQEKLQLLAEDDVKTLCKVFQNLVIQLPKDMIIFCVIDGISLYESANGVEDLLHVWQRLIQLLAHRKLKAVMKLLATSPGQTLYLHDEDMMTNGDVLLMPEEIDGNRQGVWNTEDMDESLSHL